MGYLFSDYMPEFGHSKADRRYSKFTWNKGFCLSSLRAFLATKLRFGLRLINPKMKYTKQKSFCLLCIQS